MTEGKERELTDKIRRAPRGWAWYISRAQAIAEGRPDGRDGAGP